MTTSTRKAVNDPDNARRYSHAAASSGQEHNGSGVRVQVFPAACSASATVAPPQRVGILLPGRDYQTCMTQQWQQQHHHHYNDSFEYHALIRDDFALKKPLALDAQAFVEFALNYALSHQLVTVIGFDCFSTVLASIVTQALHLPGPSFLSTFCCTVKYYLRFTANNNNNTGNGAFHDHVTAWRNAGEVTHFPVMVKSADSQFDVGNRVCHNREELEALIQSDPVLRWQFLGEATNSKNEEGEEEKKSVTDASDEKRGGALPSVGNEKEEEELKDEVAFFRRRQRFYFDWLTVFGVAKQLLVSEPNDVQLLHIEELVVGMVAEYQMEVVLLDGKVLVADTGDVLWGKHGRISLFRTPWSLPRELHESCRIFLNAIVHHISSIGFCNGVLDIEFVRTTENTYRLMEVNCRYSFMAYRSTESTILSQEPKNKTGAPLQVRNLHNRTLIALGKEPVTLPSRDHVGVSVICLYCYTTDYTTSDAGRLQDVLCVDKLDRLTLDHNFSETVFAYIHPRHLPITRQEGLYTKVGAFLFMAPDKVSSINAAISPLLQGAVKDQSKLLEFRVQHESVPVSWDWLVQS